MGWRDKHRSAVDQTDLQHKKQMGVVMDALRNEAETVRDLRQDRFTMLLALEQCTTLDGTVSDANLSTCVVELVRDHSELEARIEAVLTMPGQEDNPHTKWLDYDEVHRLLRGGSRVPDTIEEITDDDTGN